MTDIPEALLQTSIKDPGDATMKIKFCALNSKLELDLKYNVEGYTENTYLLVTVITILARQ